MFHENPTTHHPKDLTQSATHLPSTSNPTPGGLHFTRHQLFEHHLRIHNKTISKIPPKVRPTFVNSFIIYCIMKSNRSLFAPDHYYHIYNRGAHKQPIFREPRNYSFVLQKIRMYSIAHQITIIAYCLMPNHYHLLVRQDGETRAGILPQLVFNSYTKAYNKRYNHSGTLFQGSFQAIDVHNLNYCLQLCRYIHANPVKDGLVSKPDQWQYSNYHEWTGKGNNLLVDREFITDNFPEPGSYEEFVMDYLKNRSLSADLQSKIEWLER